MINIISEIVEEENWHVTGDEEEGKIVVRKNTINDDCESSLTLKKVLISSMGLYDLTEVRYIKKSNAIVQFQCQRFTFFLQKDLIFLKTWNKNLLDFEQDTAPLKKIYEIRLRKKSRPLSDQLS